MTKLSEKGNINNTQGYGILNSTQPAKSNLIDHLEHLEETQAMPLLSFKDCSELTQWIFRMSFKGLRLTCNQNNYLTEQNLIVFGKLARLDTQQ